MGYLPLYASRGMTVYKNGVLIESSVTLNYMLLTTNQSNKFSELLQVNPLSNDVSNIGFWADGHLPTNPIFTPANLSVGLSFGGACSPICTSAYLYNMLTNVNDEVLFCQGNDVSNACGFRYMEAVDSRRKSIDMVFVLNGTKIYSGVGQSYTIGESGSGSDIRYWALFFGVMIDIPNRKAYPFVVHGTYYLPYRDSDDIRVRAFIGSAARTEQVKDCMFKVFSNIPPETVPNPYEGGGYSEPSENIGEFDEDSDNIPIPTTPSSLAVDSGFLTVYNPSYTQLVALGNFIWNTDLWDTFKKAVANPMDIIMGVSLFPFLIPNDDIDWEIMVGNVHTNVVAHKALSQFVDVPCGKLFIKPYSASYMDYSPYTKIELVLPYISTVVLDTDMVMGKWLKIDYKCDLISGGCMAILSMCETENGEYSVIGEYTGKCNTEIPLVSSDFSGLQHALLGAVSSIGSYFVSGGGSREYGSVISSAGEVVANMKPNIARSGNLSSCLGLLGVQKPRIIKTIPRQCVPENQAQLQGYPTLIKSNLYDLVGFTVFEEIKIVGSGMTENERKRAHDLLLKGVWL